jgi:hypothetical protein
VTEAGSTTKKRNAVYVLTRASRCHNCDKKLTRGDVVKLNSIEDDTEALCQSCAQLDAYVLVPKGRAQITRLATKYSKTSYVVLQWDETWKAYNRVGILAEPDAVSRAEKEISA